MGALMTLENKMVIPWYSPVWLSSIYNSFRTLLGLQSNPTKGPISHTGEVNTFTTCANPQSNPVSMAGFQPILESLSPSAQSAYSALPVFPSKPIISLCCIDTKGNAQLLENEQKFIGKIPFAPLSAMSYNFWLFRPSTYNSVFFTGAFWM